MPGAPRIDYYELFRLHKEGWAQKDLAVRYGVSRAAVSKGLSRSAARRNKPRPTRPCGCGCGAQTKRKYLSKVCYYRFVNSQAGEYVDWRQGKRIARAFVAEVFDLLPGYVVHHCDKNNRNNALSNLWVFRTNGDHMSYHRGGLAAPIWRGPGSPEYVRLNANGLPQTL